MNINTNFLKYKYSKGISFIIDKEDGYILFELKLFYYEFYLVLSK
jgi:hypothetical protein